MCWLYLFTSVLKENLIYGKTEHGFLYSKWNTWMFRMRNQFLVKMGTRKSRIGTILISFQLLSKPNLHWFRKSHLNMELIDLHSIQAFLNHLRWTRSDIWMATWSASEILLQQTDCTTWLFFACFKILMIYYICLRLFVNNNLMLDLF